MSDDIKKYRQLIESTELKESVKLTKGETKLMHQLFMQGFDNGRDGSDLSKFKTQVGTHDTKAMFNASFKLENKGLVELDTGAERSRAHNQGSTKFGRSGNVVVKGFDYANVTLTQKGLEAAKDIFGDAKSKSDIPPID